MKAHTGTGAEGTSVELSTRVLGLEEDGEWCAMALDMSLRGYGCTFEDALQALGEAIDTQVSFAIQHGTLDSIFTPAEAHYVELYADMRRKALVEHLSGHETRRRGYAVSDLPLRPVPAGDFAPA